MGYPTSSVSFAEYVLRRRPSPAGKDILKNGMDGTELTSVPAAASFDSMVAAVKYLVLLVGSFKFVGMPMSTCIGNRRAMLPTYAICSEDRDVIAAGAKN